MSFYPQPAQQSEKRIIHQCPVRAPAGLLGYLDSLHTISTEQEDAIDRTEVEKVGFDNYMKDKYIALDQDKCWFVYQTCLATGARNVVEVSSTRDESAASDAGIGWDELRCQYDIPLASRTADDQAARRGGASHRDRERAREGRSCPVDVGRGGRRCS